MSDEAYARADSGSREAWLAAAKGARAKRSVAELLASWGLRFDPRYGDNSREQVRDETFPRWLDEGAVRVKPGVKTTSPLPRWALTDVFAERALLRWATQQRIPEGSCNFLTAFGSRNAGPARRRLKDLAAGTFAWYADEPTRELAWYEL